MKAPSLSVRRVRKPIRTTVTTAAAGAATLPDKPTRGTANLVITYVRG